ncbi:MAG: MFS transporter [Nanobdellota archaeon]
MKLASNVWKYYAYTSLDMFLLFGAMTKVYFLNLDFSLFQIMLLSSVAWASTFIFEIPSGVFSDFHGRKNALLISNIGFIIWVVVLFAFQQYFLILLCHIFAGIKTAFLSGADSAFIYDTLKALGKEKQYAKVQGRADSYYLLGRGVSAPLGSMIAAATSIRTTIFLTIFVSIFSLILVLLMKEPPYKKKKHRNYGLHFMETFSFIKSNRMVLWLVVFFALLAAMFKSSLQFTQIFLAEYNVSIALFGWLFLAFMIVASLGSRLYSEFYKVLGKGGIIYALGLIPPIGLFLTGFIKSVIVYIIIIFVLEVLFGLAKPAKKHIINEMTDSAKRATVLSKISFLSSIAIAILNPLLGYAGDLIGIFNLFIAGGVFWFIILLIIATISYRKSYYSE